MKKACKNCKLIYEGNKCPSCNSEESTESWKGKVMIVNPQESEIARKVGITKKGLHAIKTK